jgi:putative nucleotidyltransferase with HDIG domain/PAS domain S-box-containing protein
MRMTTVLVATERELEFNVLSQTLAGHGYALVRSKDGIEALDAIRTHKPEVLLANVVLPRLDGFSLYRRCQQDEQLRSVPMVLFSTRSNDQKSERFASELGITHFVGNALKSEQLAQIIETARTSKPEPLPQLSLAPRPAPKVEPVVAAADSIEQTPSNDVAQGETEVALLDKTLQLPGLAAELRKEAERQQLAERAEQREIDQRESHSEPARSQSVSAGSALFEHSPAAMWLVDKSTQRMLAVNEAALKLFGYERNEFMQLGADALLKAADAHGATQVKTFQSKDGRALSLLLGARDVMHAGQAAELFSAHDVSYRVRGERAIADELRRQRVLLAAMPLPYLLLNGADRVLDANEVCLRQLGYRRDQLQEADFASLVLQQDGDPSPQPGAVFTAHFKPGPERGERGEGEWHAEVQVARVDMAGDVRMLLMREVPKVATLPPALPRKLPVALEMLRYAEDADESTLLHYAMAQLAQAFDCSLALFAAMERVTQSLEILAIKQTPAPRVPHDTHVTVRAPAPWRSLFHDSGIHAQLVADDAMLVNGLPEISSYCACSVPGTAPDQQGRPAWLLVLANREAEFSEIEQQEMRECAEILVSLVARKRAQYKTQAAQQRQNAIAEGMVTLIERMMDTQDPHAAGSGRRVAALATNIARQLDLPIERVTALTLAARLHDIGHLAIPRELFLLPRPLTHTERALMKTHIELGARMLRAVDLGVEVAGIVGQHHERMDGSGYPAGSQGEQISPEARILAVADVVDAITSPRAHRPAQELSVALNELRTGSGTRYDSDVVAACERVFAALDGQWPQ